MSHAFPSSSDFATHGNVQLRADAGQIGSPRVARPREHAPNGRPISLSSTLRYDQLLDYIARRPNLSILEIGVARAANTLRMLAFADWLGGRPRYTGIDLFGLLTDELFEDSYCSQAKRPVSVEMTKAHLRLFLGEAMMADVELLEGFSHDVLPQLVAASRRYDLIFIDGGHSHECVTSDWQFAQQLLAKDGTIVFDDYPNWGVGTTVQAIDLAQWNVQVLPQRDTFQNHRTDEDPSPLRHHQLVAAQRR